MDFKNLNLLGIIALIGAILLIVGVFFDWLSYTVIAKHSFSGWDIWSDKESIKNFVGYGYVPLLALICGVISLILMILPVVMNVDRFKTINDILGIVVLILAIIVIVLGIVWYTQTVASTPLGLKHSVKLTDWYSVGSGFWLTLVGAIITAVGGLMPIVKNKLIH